VFLEKKTTCGYKSNQGKRFIFTKPTQQHINCNATALRPKYADQESPNLTTCFTKNNG